MGGILCRLQATDVGPADWTAVFHARATGLLPLVESKPLLRDALLFRANPLVKRIIFMETRKKRGLSQLRIGCLTGKRSAR